jgi:hypothetical protein
VAAASFCFETRMLIIIDTEQSAEHFNMIGASTAKLSCISDRSFLFRLCPIQNFIVSQNLLVPLLKGRECSGVKPIHLYAVK